MNVPVISFIDLSVPLWIIIPTACILLYVMFNKRWGLAWTTRKMN